MMKDAIKNGMKNPSLPPVPTTLQNKENIAYITEERLTTVVQDLQKVLNYARFVENKMWLLTETLARKEIIKLSDLTETEALYAKKEEIKKQRVKELLSLDRTVLEYLEDIKESSDLLGFQKLNIHPVKDLNLNPFEVAHTLKELHPNLPPEKYLEMGRKWDLTHENFGFKKPETK